MDGIGDAKRKSNLIASTNKKGKLKLMRLKRNAVKEKTTLSRTAKLMSIVNVIESQYNESIRNASLTEQRTCVDRLLKVSKEIIEEASRIETLVQKQTDEVKKLNDQVITIEEKLLKNVYELHVRQAKRQAGVTIYNEERIMEEMDGPFEFL